MGGSPSSQLLGASPLVSVSARDRPPGLPGSHFYRGLPPAVPALPGQTDGRERGFSPSQGEEAELPCEHGAQAGGAPRGQQGAEDPAGLGRIPETALVGGSPDALMGSGGGFPNGKWEEARIRVLWALLSLESLSPVWGGRDPHRRPGRY